MWVFEEYFYKELGFGVPDINNCENVLGRNFSYFIFEEGGKNWMVLLDADDGSGIALLTTINLMKELSISYSKLMT